MPELEAGPQRRPPTTGTPNVPVPENIFAGQSQALQHLGSNIQRMGWNIGMAARRSEYAEEIEQFETGELEYETFKLQEARARVNDKNLSEHAPSWNKRSGEFLEKLYDRTTSAPARERLKRDLDFQAKKHELQIWSQAQNTRITNIEMRRPSMEKKIGQAWLDARSEEEKGDIIKAMETDLKRKDAEGLLIKPIEEYKSDFAFSLGKLTIERDPVLTSKMLSKGGDPGVLMPDEYVKKLKPEHFRSLRELAASKMRYMSLQKNQAELELLGKYSEMAWDFGRVGDVNGAAEMAEGIFPGQLYLEDGTLVADIKRDLVAGASLTANRLSKGKSSPYTTRQDEPAYYEISTRLLNDPSSVSDQEIDAGVPHRWTTADREKLRKDKKTTENAAFQEFPAKQYLDSFDNLVFEEASESLKGMIFYTMGKRALMDFAVDSPDATPTQWAEEYSEIIEPFLADWTKAFFRRNWDRLTEELQETSGKATNVKKSPYEEWPDAYQENGVWYVKKDGKRYRIQD